ncbi:MAG: HAD family hydrolase [Ferruginibacter sp.]|jgi:hydroxymethylpyrimidine pyrophosphatase-like HAD family hydrolase
MILATDLDSAFLGGQSLHKQQLYRLIRKNASIRLIFVTGRGLESVIPLLNDPIIPNPDFIICDVGATVVNGHTLEPVEPLQNEIDKKWPGRLKIFECLNDFTTLQYQDVPQQHRCSFYCTDEKMIQKVGKKVNAIDCSIIHSAGKYLDVMPQGTDKGNTLLKLVNYLNADVEDVLVAGATLNDLSMYQYGFKGVVVGKSEQKLVQLTRNITNVYTAKEEGAGGIIEAIRNFDLLAHSAINITAETLQLEKMSSSRNALCRH